MTSLDDDIRLNDVRNQPDSVEVRQRTGRNPWVKVIYTDISQIQVFGGEGDDDITADRRLSIPVRLYGGAGDDRIFREDGNDILVGGIVFERVTRKTC